MVFNATANIFREITVDEIYSEPERNVQCQRQRRSQGFQVVPMQRLDLAGTVFSSCLSQNIAGSNARRGKGQRAQVGVMLRCEMRHYDCSAERPWVPGPNSHLGLLPPAKVGV